MTIMWHAYADEDTYNDTRYRLLYWVEETEIHKEHM
jgi:hypothetical protein